MTHKCRTSILAGCRTSHALPLPFFSAQNYHFYEWGTHRNASDEIDLINGYYPWSKRKNVAFGTHTCVPLAR